MIRITGLRIGIVTLIASLFLLAAFETARLLLGGSDTLWQARIGVLGAGLLIGNLLVLWWYASLTRDLASAAQEQIKLSEHQNRAAARPCVVIEENEPSLPRAANIGNGIAINVVIIENVTAQTPTFTPIGALGPSTTAAVDPGLSPRTTVGIDWDRNLVWTAAESSDSSEWAISATRWKHPPPSARKETESINKTGYATTATTDLVIEHRRYSGYTRSTTGGSAGVVSRVAENGLAKLDSSVRPTSSHLAGHFRYQLDTQRRVAGERIGAVPTARHRARQSLCGELFMFRPCDENNGGVLT